MRSHAANKKPYDKKAKPRSFDVGSYVYLFNSARKPGLSKKFFSVWSGPYRVTAKLSYLNYEILGQNGRKFVVHLNRLKAPRAAIRLKHQNGREGRDPSETRCLGQTKKLICIPQPSSLIHWPAIKYWQVTPRQYRLPAR